MKLNPRYGTNPIITLDGAPADIAGPVIAQRQRFAAVLTSFTDDQWAHPSRCAGWSNRDVVVHLDSTNTFWHFSIAAGLLGEPTQFLSTFDPAASPIELVDASADVPTEQVLKNFVASTETLVDLLASLGESDWAAVAEAPPGHLSVSAVAHHALWDSWIHERDVLIPLGLPIPSEPDEVAACLRYVAALGPALGTTRDSALAGVLALDVTDPELGVRVSINDSIHVAAGSGDADLVLDGDAVALVEALSLRRPFDQPIPAEFARSWILSGIGEA